MKINKSIIFALLIFQKSMIGKKIKYMSLSDAFKSISLVRFKCFKAFPRTRRAETGKRHLGTSIIGILK